MIKFSAIMNRLKAILLMCFYNTICKTWIELFGVHDKRKLKYRLSLCLIFKNEALFLKEWLDYHLTIGIDHFYLYNNNSDDNFREVLKKYIEDGTVTLIEWPEQNSQFKCYKHCYETYRNESNWISFLDADEFICPKYQTNINDWLKDFDKYPAINIQFLMFGTNGQLKHDYSRNVIEQYNSCWEDLYFVGKCLINTRYDISEFESWHMHHHTYMKIKAFGLKFTLPAFNQFGYSCVAGSCWGGGKNKLQNSTIRINHYYTKAFEIYDRKAKGTDVLRKVNPKADYQKFYMCEDACINKDYTIHRFLIRMEVLRNGKVCK